MYAPPPVAAGGSNRSGLVASAPVLAICCLLCILFVIASVIILALIPVYVAKSNTINVPTYTYYVGSNNTIVQSRGNIANIIARAFGLTPGQVTVKSVTPTTGKRKRRGFGLSRSRRASYNNIVYGTASYPGTGFSGITCVTGTYNGNTVVAGTSVTIANLYNGCTITTTTASPPTG